MYKFEFDYHAELSAYMYLTDLFFLTRNEKYI